MFNKKENSNFIEQTQASYIPKSFKEYQLDYKNPMFESDDEVLERFYNAGFNNNQAQLVFDLANERILPYIKQMASEFEAQKQMEKLVQYFGSQEKFAEVARQISLWGKKNFQPEVYDALGSTSEGVMALYKMMSSNEPNVMSDAMSQEPLNEETLTQMMQDPRYWQTKDKDYVAKITKGFEKLYDK